MTKEEWDKQQSVIRRVYDPETGRNRYILCKILLQYNEKRLVALENVITLRTARYISNY